MELRKAGAVLVVKKDRNYLCRIVLERYVKDKAQIENYRRRLNYQQEAIVELKILGYMAMIARE